ncbi:MAG: flagellar basal-body MS-ring/collar protein FliF [candidate division Zixibacteria bacterium]|nr:flagellar basal-body MS-ring/collar protein FliF [candidate division Zixibacteria bacterium]
MNLTEIKNQLVNLWGQMSLLKKVTLGILVLIIFSGLIVIYSRAHKVEFVTLYSGLEADEAGTIIEKLKSSKVSYKISEGGKVISVPSDEAEEVRLQLAREGIPKSGVGYEIFDKKTWGMTDFVEKINYKRALEGELSRTIGELKEVESVRVHLVLPEERLFKEDKSEPSASVMLKLKPGFKLSSSQALGIAKLIANSIEGLSTSNVTIIDFNGDILFSGETEVSPEGLLSSPIQAGKETGEDLKNKASTLSGYSTKTGEKENSVSNPLYRYSWILLLVLTPLLFYIALRWFKSRKPVNSFTNLRKTQAEFESGLRKSELDSESEEIRDSDTEVYFELLKDETPHNISIILSQISNSKAENILTLLPSEKQTEVALALSRVGEISTEVKKRVWQAFESLLTPESKYTSSYLEEDQTESGKTEVLHSKY